MNILLTDIFTSPRMKNMLDAIFAIKPKYVEKIFSGEKRFEFRTAVCKQQIKKMIIYETSPTSKIVGEVHISKILADTPENIWIQTKEYAGIDYDSFMNYFKNRETAFAYVLEKPAKYETSKLLSEYNIKSVPQSFIYLK